MKIRHRRAEAVEGITAGPVMIPRFDTLKKLSEHASALRLSSAILAAEKRDTKPFAILTSEFSAAMLAARMNGGYSLWAVDGAAVGSGGSDSVPPCPG